MLSLRFVLYAGCCLVSLPLLAGDEAQVDRGPDYRRPIRRDGRQIGYFTFKGRQDAAKFQSLKALVEDGARDPLDKSHTVNQSRQESVWRLFVKASGVLIVILAISSYLRGKYCDDLHDNDDPIDERLVEIHSD